MPAPSAAHIGAHLGGSGSSDAKVQTLLTAMYVLGLGVSVSSLTFSKTSFVAFRPVADRGRRVTRHRTQFGPFIFSPVAELYGRQSAYITSTLPFALFNASCLLAPKFVLPS